MLSAVQHRTRVALRSARRESGHFHSYSKPVQEHWGKYPGGSTDGSSGYTHGHGLQGSEGALWNGPHQFPLGLVFTKRKKDIATDTFVREAVWGRPVGEDSQVDLMAWLCILGGAGLVIGAAEDTPPRGVSQKSHSFYRPHQRARYMRGAIGLVAFATGVGHVIPGTVNLRG